MMKKTLLLILSLVGIMGFVTPNHPKLGVFYMTQHCSMFYATDWRLTLFPADQTYSFHYYNGKYQTTQRHTGNFSVSGDTLTLKPLSMTSQNLDHSNQQMPSLLSENIDLPDFNTNTRYTLGSHIFHQFLIRPKSLDPIQGVTPYHVSLSKP